MEKPLIITSLCLASAFSMSSFASNQPSHNLFETEITSSASEAYAQGYKIMAQLSESTPTELSGNISTTRKSIKPRSFIIDDSYVTVYELTDVTGETSYKGVVNIDYRYLY